ncbi:hypothetical protein FOCC_FOCC014554 [Frankliniella occidentalis]|nr:hypothetical protein FOCC_FOCC014554 [Frankliniella occidentalis]
MGIRSDLVYNSRTGELVGYTNLTSLEKSMRELDAELEEKPYENRLAKKILVFMLNGAVNNIRFVPAVFSTDDLSAGQLYMRTWDVIYVIEEAGAKVLSVIFGGASMNKKFLSMNFNAGAKSFVHQTINQYSLSFSCMKVSLATQVLSGSVADALVQNKDVSPLKEVYSEELVKLIRLVNRAFDCFNGSIDSKKRETNPDLDVYCSIDDARFQFLESEFLGYLSDWEESVSRREGQYTKEERSRMIISYQPLEGLKITIASFVKVVKFLLLKGAQHVSARQFNQDPLEQYFSTIRRIRGSDDHPNLKQALHSRVGLQAELEQGTYSGGMKGNTEAFKRHLDVIDDSPLPVRKKKK